MAAPLNTVPEDAQSAAAGNPNIFHRNGTASAAPGDPIVLPRQVKRLHVVVSANTVQLSFNGGATGFSMQTGIINVIELPHGTSQFRVMGSGTYEILAS